jgi:hypothetical protein
VLLAVAGNKGNGVAGVDQLYSSFYAGSGQRKLAADLFYNVHKNYS